VRPLPDAYARDLADIAAGGSIAHWQQTLQQAQRGIDVWVNTYSAALKSPQHQTAIALPLTVPDVARRLRCGTPKVRELVHTGKLQKIEELGGKTLTKADSVERKQAGTELGCSVPALPKLRLCC